MRWSFSGTTRVMRCAASAALPHVRGESTVHADDGTTVHAFFRGALTVGREPALAAIEDDDMRERCAAIDFAPIFALGKPVSSERAYAYDIETGEGRVLGDNVGRNYGALRPTEIAGATDLTLVNDDGLVTVPDIKSGWMQVEPDTEQVRMQALAVAAAEGLDVVRLGVIRCPESGGTYVDTVVMDELDLGAFAHEVRETYRRVREAASVVAAGRVPDVYEGEHCRYCPAFRACPAKVALARAIVDTGPASLAMTSVVAMSPEEAGAAWAKVKAAKPLLEAIEAALRQRIEHEGSLPLPDGKEVTTTTVTIRKVDGKLALPILRQRIGAEAEQFVKTAIPLSKLDGETIAALDAAGAITRTTYPKTVERKSRSAA